MPARRPGESQKISAHFLSSKIESDAMPGRISEIDRPGSIQAYPHRADAESDAGDRCNSTTS